MSDRTEMLAFLRRAARHGNPVDSRTVGYLLADYDRILTAARAVVGLGDPLPPTGAVQELRRIVVDLAT